MSAAPHRGHGVATVLVTGATGQVGREVVRACSDVGLTPRAAARDASSAARAFPGADVAALDLRDRTTWAPALDGATHLFLLRPPAIADVDATLAPFLDEAASRLPPRGHVVFLSVAGAERMRWVPHRAVERHLAAGPLPWTVLRPGFFAQNFETSYRRDVLEDARVYVPAGEGRVAFVDTRDLGDAVAQVLLEPTRHRGAALTLTGPAAVGFAEAAAILTELLGRRIRYVPASVPGYAWHAWRRRGLPPAQVAVQTVLHLGLRRGDAERVDPTLPRLLGRPATPLREPLRRLFGH